MNESLLYHYLERISNLLRADERRSGSLFGLQPVQLEALHFLSRCNRYSNTPAGVTEFLSLTKGTVSQTLQVLEHKGYLEKVADAKDRRVVHLQVTATGRDALSKSMPPAQVSDALCALSEEQAALALWALKGLLQSLQNVHGGRSFGVCRTCRFCRDVNASEGVFQCGLTSDVLTSSDVKLICREHEAKGSD